MANNHVLQTASFRSVHLVFSSEWCYRKPKSVKWIWNTTTFCTFSFYSQSYWTNFEVSSIESMNGTEGKPIDPDLHVTRIKRGSYGISGHPTMTDDIQGYTVKSAHRGHHKQKLMSLFCAIARRKSSFFTVRNGTTISKCCHSRFPRDHCASFRIRSIASMLWTRYAVCPICRTPMIQWRICVCIFRKG